jgi:PRTase ComF-like
MHSTLSGIKATNFSKTFKYYYSRFKHGSLSCANYFGRLVAKSIELYPNSNLVVYSSPYQNIRTASDVFKDSLLVNLTEQFIAKNISVRLDKISREYSYQSDYGTLSKDERIRMIQHDDFHIDKSLIQKTDTLVFIDDIKITGTHERMILEMIEREGITNPILFIYIAEYEGDDPTIESRLNNYNFLLLADINELISNNDFVFIPRAIKFILGANPIDFEQFIFRQSHNFCYQLLYFAYLNKYMHYTNLQRNLAILQDIVHEKKSFAQGLFCELV